MEKTKEPVFNRRSRIGMSILSLEKGLPEYIEIKDFGTYTAKDGREIPKFDVVNLRTGEEQTLWVDGGMKGQLSSLGGPTKAIGMQLEITLTGQKEVEMMTDKNKIETVRVNQYEIFEVDSTLN